MILIMIPEVIKLSQDKASILVNWPDGNQTQLSAFMLREHCNSARAKRARIDFCEEIIPKDITISKVRNVGLYAINLVFSDGHDKGIYPWSYLKELGDMKA